MTPQELQQLDGKLRRTCYAITRDHLVTLTDTLDAKQVKKLAEGIHGAITDAVNDSMEFLLQYEIVKPMRAKKKAKKK
jgi:hypothetical protein